MSAVEWIANARTELDELRGSPEWTDSSARRAWVLVARLVQARRAGHEVGFDVRDSDWLPERPPPAASCRELLERLDAHLSEEDDARGPLFDTLLDIDDVLTLHDAFGPLPDAQALARDSAAFVALSPERAAVLGPQAEVRLETLPSDALARPLWTAVGDAAFALATEHRPDSVLSSVRDAAVRRKVLALLERPVDIRGAPSLRRVLAPAAAMPTPSEPFEHGRYSVYDHDAKVVVHVRLDPTHDRVTGNVTVRVSHRTQAVQWEVDTKVRRHEAIAVLGTLDELKQRLVALGFGDVLAEVEIAVSLPIEVQDGE